MTPTSSNIQGNLIKKSCDKVTGCIILYICYSTFCAYCETVRKVGVFCPSPNAEVTMCVGPHIRGGCPNLSNMCKLCD